MSAIPAGHDTSLRRTPIRVGISARHVHLSREHLEVLFGPGHSLHPKRDLSQPGQFAAQETCVVAGPGGAFPNVRVLGPVRNVTQVEMSASDCRTLGAPVQVRDSGDIQGTPGCVLVGPAGSVQLERGVIVAARHIHMTSNDAALLGLADKAAVPVLAGSGSRLTVFANVTVRVSDKYRLELHVDTDEANAAGLSNDDIVWIIDAPGPVTGATAQDLPMAINPATTRPVLADAGSREIAVVPAIMDLTDRSLITEDDVIAAWRQGAAIKARPGALFTPLADDARRERRVELIMA